MNGKRISAITDGESGKFVTCSSDVNNSILFECQVYNSATKIWTGTIIKTKGKLQKKLLIMKNYN